MFFIEMNVRTAEFPSFLVSLDRYVKMFDKLLTADGQINCIFDVRPCDYIFNLLVIFVSEQNLGL